MSKDSRGTGVWARTGLFGIGRTTKSLVWWCLCLRGSSFEASEIAQHFPLFFAFDTTGERGERQRVLYYNTPFVEERLVFGGQVG
jgi:hypothetical protein